MAQHQQDGGRTHTAGRPHDWVRWQLPVRDLSVGNTFPSTCPSQYQKYTDEAVGSVSEEPSPPTTTHKLHLLRMSLINRLPAALSALAFAH